MTDTLMPKDDVVCRLRAAYSRLIRNDRYLLEVGANERSITHKLAEYLQDEFPKWDVDCEYNRDGKDNLPKRLMNTIKSVQTNDTNGGTVFPDIVVRRRGTNKNLLVIEAKKKGAATDNADQDKLQAYKTEYGYKFAFAITLPVKTESLLADPSIDIREVK
jgi:hypothetical protein